MNQTSFVQLYVHLVWATWDRLRVITSQLEGVLGPVLRTKAADLDCRSIALGIVEDHVHNLLSVPATLAVATLAKELKGASSHAIGQEFGRGGFKWQAGYGGFTVSRGDVPRIRAYVLNQREHHARQRLWHDLELIHPDGSAT